MDDKAFILPTSPTSGEEKNQGRTILKSLSRLSQPPVGRQDERRCRVRRLSEHRQPTWEAQTSDFPLATARDSVGRFPRPRLPDDAEPARRVHKHPILVLSLARWARNKRYPAIIRKLMSRRLVSDFQWKNGCSVSPRPRPFFLFHARGNSFWRTLVTSIAWCFVVLVKVRKYRS